MKNGKGIIGRHVAVRGRRGEWVVRTLETRKFGVQFGLTREGGDKWILAPRAALKFVRGSYQVKLQPGEVVI